MTGKVVDELRIRLIRGEHAMFSYPFVTGGRSYRNRRRLQRRPMTNNEGTFLAGYVNCSSCLQSKRCLWDIITNWLLLINYYHITARLYYLLLINNHYSYKIFFLDINNNSNSYSNHRKLVVETSSIS